MHISIPLENTMEYVNSTEITPFVSKVQIKVCYIGENRNGTAFSKETAREMGRRLPGSPIVGYYNEDTQDFEQHNRAIEIKNGKYRLVDTTKAYGFVPTDARVWFQKFRDDGVEHEYLCTEGWLWTHVYEEAQRIISKGNNQSMEVDRKTSKGVWADSENSHKRIFIYNEALIEKLCVLGETCEPCFEGAQIKSQFALHQDELNEIKRDLYAMMNKLKEALEEGGTKVFTTYAVQIGDTLWSALYSFLETNYPEDNYSIRGVFEDEAQKFAVIQKGEEETLYRMNFAFNEDALECDGEMSEFSIEAEQLAFSLEDNANFKKQEENDPEEDKNDEEDNNNGEDNTEDEDKKKKYNLEEVVEYTELKQQYDELQSKYAALEESNNTLTAEIATLKEFKLAAEKEKKQAMIDSFYMLNDEDKQDCIDHIDTYSLDEIEAKLSIICVHNKVSFAKENDDSSNGAAANMFNLNNDEDTDDAPDWVKAVRQRQKK